MSDTLRLPATFYDDHEARDLPTPVALKRTARHVVVAADDAALAELASDAQHYASEYGPSEPRGIKAAARACLRALA